jgi:hypothetical protein
MALVPSTLATQLENGWMAAAAYPQNAFESGQRFAAAVADWFSAAQANAIPCATAKLREPQLAAQATLAFQAQSAPAAGSQLALAVAAYYAGTELRRGGRRLSRRRARRYSDLRAGVSRSRRADSGAGAADGRGVPCHGGLHHRRLSAALHAEPDLLKEHMPCRPCSCESRSASVR